MEKKNRILIIAKSPDGGAATFINSLIKINRLSSGLNLDWHVLAIEKPTFSTIDSSNFSYLRKFRYKNSYRFLPVNFIQFFKDLTSTYRKIKKVQPKIIVAIDLYPGLLVTILKKMSSVKSSIVLINQANLKAMTESKSSLIFRELLFVAIRILYRSADYIVSTAKKTSEDMVTFFKLPKKKVITIYNGVEVPKKELRRRAKVKNIILMIAKFIEPKDHETLLKAFALVLKSFPDYKLQLVGDGPKKPKIELLAKELGISKSVDFLGWKKNVYPYIARCKIFVLSTKNEGFGYVLVEAMAFGKPVIATDAPWGPREILGNSKFGSIFKVGSELELSNKIIELLKSENNQKFYSQLSLKRASDFKIQRFREKYTKILKELINNQRF